MIQVTMYQCEYCKKYFKTPDRHKCRYNPKFKNCFSCKHNKGFEQESHGYGQIDVFLECEAKNDTLPSYEAKEECDLYEYCGGKWFENEHNKTNHDKEVAN